MDDFLRRVVEQRERERVEQLMHRSSYANPVCPHPDCGAALVVGAKTCWECVEEGRAAAPKRVKLTPDAEKRVVPSVVTEPAPKRETFRPKRQPRPKVRREPDAPAQKCVECLRKLRADNTTGLCSSCQTELRLTNRALIRVYIRCKVLGVDFDSTLENLCNAWAKGEVRLG